MLYHGFLTVELQKAGTRIDIFLNKVEIRCSQVMTLLTERVSESCFLSRSGSRV